ncbi:hypothetical protein FCN80_00865 [Martelella alba]|uniref:Uncharacterized protein n=1 Tax=Martelella alba TaxID=2590451 RepID=A0ABY2SSE9_9HYPH|nr:hypothetical protein FCN80_00865 [Martelella alba]
MKAKEFNQQYAVGQSFIYKPPSPLRGGKAVRTVDVARDLKESTIVEINLEPWFANVKSLTPAS